MPDTYSSFVYGTLMSPAIIRRVCYGPELPNSTTRTLPMHLKFHPAVLAGFQRHRVRIADYPAIIRRESSTVRGMLVSGLTEGDMGRLDIFEGEEYARIKVRVRLVRTKGDLDDEGVKAGGGLTGSIADEADLEDEVPTETYIWIGDGDSLAEEEWDFDEFVRERLWRWVGSGGETEGEYEGGFSSVEINSAGWKGLPDCRSRRSSPCG
jgi:gamma-glutamylcyclotransferase (GGCT)/AIG2-like uncharacterized protein YtfP